MGTNCFGWCEINKMTTTYLMLQAEWYVVTGEVQCAQQDGAEFGLDRRGLQLSPHPLDPQHLLQNNPIVAQQFIDGLLSGDFPLAV
jgi:hypothetical protein